MDIYNFFRHSSLVFIFLSFLLFPNSSEAKCRPEEYRFVVTSIDYQDLEGQLVALINIENRYIFKSPLFYSNDSMISELESAFLLHEVELYPDSGKRTLVMVADNFELIVVPTQETLDMLPTLDSIEVTYVPIYSRNLYIRLSNGEEWDTTKNIWFNPHFEDFAKNWEKGDRILFAPAGLINVDADPYMPSGKVKYYDWRLCKWSKLDLCNFWDLLDE